MPCLPARQSWPDQCRSRVLACPGALQVNTLSITLFKSGKQQVDGPWPCGATRPKPTPTFALDRAIFAPDGRHLESADASSVPAFGLEKYRLALLVEETWLVDGGRCGEENNRSISERSKCIHAYSYWIRCENSEDFIYIFLFYCLSRNDMFTSCFYGCRNGTVVFPPSFDRVWGVDVLSILAGVGLVSNRQIFL